MPPSVGDKSSLLEQLRIDRETRPGPPRIAWRWWIAGIVSLLLLSAGWFIFTSPVGVPVHVAVARAIATAEPGTSAASGGSLLDASGYVVALRQAAVSGKNVYKVVEVLIEAGQRVKKDQVIARLDDTNNHAAQLQAQAQVNRPRRRSRRPSSLSPMPRRFMRAIKSWSRRGGSVTTSSMFPRRPMTRRR